MQAIETRYLSPTNTKGARIIATTQGNRKIIAFDTAMDNKTNHAHAAKFLREKLEWYGVMVGGATQKGMVWIFTDNPEDTIPA